MDPEKYALLFMSVDCYLMVGRPHYLRSKPWVVASAEW
jgi:hypothetical protein